MVSLIPNEEKMYCLYFGGKLGGLFGEYFGGNLGVKPQIQIQIQYLLLIQ